MPELETLPATEPQGYTYQRANGAVEHAATREEVLAVCSEMAKLAIESPDIANALLELSVMTSADIAAMNKNSPSEASSGKGDTAYEESSKQREASNSEVSKRDIIKTSLKDLDKKDNLPTTEAPETFFYQSVMSQPDGVEIINVVRAREISDDDIHDAYVLPEESLPDEIGGALVTPEEVPIAPETEVVSYSVSRDKNRKSKKIKPLVLSQKIETETLVPRLQSNENVQSIVDESDSNSEIPDVVESSDMIDVEVTTQLAETNISDHENSITQIITEIAEELYDQSGTDILPEVNRDIDREPDVTELHTQVNEVVADINHEVVELVESNIPASEITDELLTVEEIAATAPVEVPDVEATIFNPKVEDIQNIDAIIVSPELEPVETQDWEAQLALLQTILIEEAGNLIRANELADRPLEQELDVPIAVYELPALPWLVSDEQVVDEEELEIPEILQPFVDVIDVITEAAQADNEESKNIQVLLEDIANLPEMIDISDTEQIPVLEAELRVLYIKIFEEIGINYTDEMIEAFVVITRINYLRNADELQQSKTDADDLLLNPARPSPELLTYLSKTKQSRKQALLKHFSMLGKSVLSLYHAEQDLAKGV